MAYEEIKTLDQAKQVISEQDRMIGELTRSVNYLKESEFRRGQWLDKAKKEAGKVLHHNEYYFGIGSSSRSFDDVWKEMLDNVQPVD